MSTPLCSKCERPKEPSRVKSKKCRACDGADRAARGRASHATKPMRRLTLDLPVDVWDRLDAEARLDGQRIAGFTQGLIVKRDDRKHPPAST